MVRIDQFRSAMRNALPSASLTKRHIRAALLIVGLNAMASVGAAQSEGGGGGASGQVCGTAVSQGISQTAQLALGIGIVVAVLVAGLLHLYGGMKRRPQEADEIYEWRNRAALAVPGAPILMWFVIQIASNFSIPVISCINLLPF